MRFLYYSTAYHATHGGSIQSIEFYDHLKQFDEITDLSVFPTGLNPHVLQSKSPLRTFLRKMPLLQILFFYRRNKMYLKGLEDHIVKFQPDVVMIQTDSNFLQIKKLKSRFPKLLICTQINASPFDEPFKNISFRNYFQKKQSKEYAHADLNFFVSQFLCKRIMKNHANSERDKVVHNGTDINKFKPLGSKVELRNKHGYGPNGFIMGYIGTLDHHKKVELLLLSLQKLKDKNLVLVIIGDGPAMDFLKEESRSLKIEDKVVFKGWINHDLINEHLNCFDLAIHHHANEYMSPLKIFEYLSSGLPVIAPNIAAVKEILRDNEDVVLTEPTVDSITENILDLYEDEEKRNLLASRGGNKIREKFTWKDYTRNIVETIKPKLLK